MHDGYGKTPYILVSDNMTSYLDILLKSDGNNTITPKPKKKKSKKGKENKAKGSKLITPNGNKKRSKDVMVDRIKAIPLSNANKKLDRQRSKTKSTDVKVNKSKQKQKTKSTPDLNSLLMNLFIDDDTAKAFVESRYHVKIGMYFVY